MTLNKDQIKKAGLVIDANDSNFKNASYDLTVCSIIDMKGVEHEFYKIPPQGMAYVIFKERVKLTDEHIGFAHVKTSLTQRGIMATNIGIIDSGYEGNISTLLINFGSSSETIEEGDSALRLTFNSFEKIDATQKNIIKNNLSVDEYIRLRRKDTDNLADQFLNLSNVKDEVFKRVIKTLIGLSIVFSGASFAISMYFQNKSSKDKDIEKLYNKNEVLIKELLEENVKFKKSIYKTIDSINMRGGKKR